MDWQDLINQTLLINKTQGREGLFMSQAFKTRWRVPSAAYLAGQSGVTVFFELCLPAGASA